MELENGTVDKGMWTKAYVDANGDEKAQKLIYIRRRVAEFAAEVEVKQESVKVRIQENRTIPIPPRIDSGTAPQKPSKDSLPSISSEDKTWKVVVIGALLLVPLMIVSNGSVS